MACKKLILTIAALVLVSTAEGQQPNSTPLDLALLALPSVEWGPNRDTLIAIDQAIAAGLEVEDRLLPVLTSQGSTTAAKSYICRKLKQIGTAQCVPALGSLLNDPDLSHMARFALESIPDIEASETLVNAIPTLNEPTRVGVVSSLGRRGDATATQALAEMLNSDSETTVCASLIALASIDSKFARESVQDFLTRSSGLEREVALDACLRVLQRLIENGNLEEATNVLNTLQEVGDPRLKFAIFRGRLLCDPDKSTERLLAAMQADDDQLSRFAVEFVRRSATQQQVDILAEAIPNMSLERQILLLGSLNERESPAVRRTALSSLGSRDEALLEAAVRALGVSGSAEDATALITLASRGHESLFDEIVEALSVLDGSEVESVLIGTLLKSDANGQIVAVEALKNRGSRKAMDSLLALTRNDNESVQIAALRALEAMPHEAVIAPMIEMLAVIPTGAVRNAVERTLWLTCLKTLEPGQRSEPLLQALARADRSRRIALLPCLGRLGGDKALHLVRDEMDQDDSELSNAAVRALTNWPDDTVADEMWEIARNAKKKEHRIWAIRGFARVIARQGRSKPDGTCLRLQQALEIAERVEDRQLILSRLTSARTPASLEIALGFVEDPQLKPSALEAAAALGEAMKDTHPIEAREALERVAALTPDPDTQLYISKLLWNMEIKGN